MDVKKVYLYINGDYNKAFDVFRSDTLLEKFLNKFINSDEMELLYNSIVNKDYEESFRYAHTIKGMSMSLYLTDLILISKKLVDLYKDKDYDDTKILNLYKELETKYSELENLIKKI